MFDADLAVIGDGPLRGDSERLARERNWHHAGLRWDQDMCACAEKIEDLYDDILSVSTSPAKRSELAYHILFSDTQGNSLVSFPA